MSKKKKEVVKIKRKHLTLATNKNRLMSVSALVSVTQPWFSLDTPTHDGKVSEPCIGIGGVNYTLKLKDNIFKYAGDHAEPYASAKGVIKEDDGDENLTATMEHICIGNTAIISDVESATRWKKGWVVGKHGGAKHVMIYFTDEILEKMPPYTDIMVKSYGQGLRFLDFPEIRIINIDPRLLERINLKIKKGKIVVPVTGIIPSRLMGSGLGEIQSYGDYDMMNSDMGRIRKLGLDKLKIGDLVAVQDHYGAHGYTYIEGSWSIGVIVHGACLESGHGAGVCVIMTDKSHKIEPVVVKKSNIDQYHIW